MKLDFTALKQANDALQRAVAVVDDVDEMARMTQDQRSTLRAGVIQHFEFTYELSWKFMKRWLVHSNGYHEVDGVSRRELFRIAAQHHLIDRVEKWFDFHTARNKTSHTYSETVAEEILAVARQFAPAARALLATLQERSG